MTTIVVSGALANKAGNGGEAWVRMSWVRGFARLGLRTIFVEQIASSSCVDKDGHASPPQTSVNVAWFERVTSRFGLRQRSALLNENGDSIAGGMNIRDVESGIQQAIAVINISGNLTLDRLLGANDNAVYVDIDPGFTQYWHDAGLLGNVLERHGHHVTIGGNIGSTLCAIPTGPFTWRHMNQPVILEDWPLQPPTATGRFTTVATWRGPFGPLVANGRSYGLKAHEFRRLIDLPRRVEASCEIALSIDATDDADRRLLLDHGWILRDPQIVAGDTDAFCSYVQNSMAELSVAQGLYVDTKCGWFSDRSTRYLASGRPVVVQDTGLARHLPVGEGLLTFDTADEAAVCVGDVLRCYEKHRWAARSVAETHFDSDVVLPKLLETIGVNR